MRKKRLIGIIFVGLTVGVLLFGTLQATGLISLESKEEWVESEHYSISNVPISFLIFEQFLLKPEVNGTLVSNLPDQSYISLIPNITLSASFNPKTEIIVANNSCEASEMDGVYLNNFNVISENTTFGAITSINSNSTSDACFTGKKFSISLDLSIQQYDLHRYDLNSFLFMGAKWVDKGVDISKTPYHRVVMKFQIKKLNVLNSFVGIGINKEDYMTNSTWDFENGPYPDAARILMQITEENRLIISRNNLWIGSNQEFLNGPDNNSFSITYDPILVLSSKNLGSGIGLTDISLQFTEKFEYNSNFPAAELNQFYPSWYAPNANGEEYHLEVNQLSFGSLWIREYAGNNEF